MSDHTPTQEQSANIPYGYCHCGCGQLAPIAKMTNKRLGHKKGEPVRFCHGHGSASIRQVVLDVSLPIGSRGIPLTRGKVAVVDAADYEWIVEYRWHATRDRRTWYAARNNYLPDGTQQTIRMHRAIMCAGGDDKVDHRNGDGLDNRRENLRIATNQENLNNRSANCNNSSGYKGVTFDKREGKWRAKIMVDGKSKHLGYFVAADDAARAYDVAARKFQGEFGFQNHPALTVSE